MNLIIKYLAPTITLLFISVSVHAQDNFTGYGQVLDVSRFKGQSFTLTVSSRIDDKNSSVAWIACLDDENNFINNYFGSEHPPKDSLTVWSDLVVSGRFDKKVSKAIVGVIVHGKGEYYYDNFYFEVKGRDKFVPILSNFDFEDLDVGLSKFSFVNDQGAIATIMEDDQKPTNHVLKITVNKPDEIVIGSNSEAGNFANVNGVKLYYETYGEGEPLLLLHGALESISSYGAVIPILQKHYRVIALDSRGHGKSTADDRKLSYELYAEDVSKFLEELGIDSVNVLGWSDGGNTGMILAMNHPDKVNGLAIMGANLYNNKTSIEESVNRQIRRQIAKLESEGKGSNDSFELRVKKTLLTEPNIRPQSLKGIKCRTLVMSGEADIVKESHTKLIANSIEDSRLIIFKGTGHHAPQEIPDTFAEAVIDFFSTF